MQRTLNKQPNLLLPPPRAPSKSETKDSKNNQKSLLYNLSYKNQSLFDISEHSQSQAPSFIEPSQLQQQDTPNDNSSQSVSQFVCWDQSSRKEVKLYTESTSKNGRKLNNITIKTAENGENSEKEPRGVEDELFDFMFMDL
ncbi:Hypothetical_protein [Hexamita inflata]|uniref:Hypothetical_protein n=1 Tax=Hexamita inflata TaxID=28002 RepID=A0AA86ULS5_9EUKA|nr:Hypothetical protein HINF_LOCUS31893 [Hexamita inflata]